MNVAKYKATIENSLKCVKIAYTRMITKSAAQSVAVEKFTQQKDDNVSSFIHLMDEHAKFELSISRARMINDFVSCVHSRTSSLQTLIEESLTRVFPKGHTYNIEQLDSKLKENIRKLNDTLKAKKADESGVSLKRMTNFLSEEKKKMDDLLNVLD